MNYWIVGEVPGKRIAKHPHLWLLPDDTGKHHSDNRLLEITGWTRDQFLQVFTIRTNVWTKPPLSMRAGREHAAAIAIDAETADAYIVILGSRAAKIFGMECAPYFRWFKHYAVVPHPSSRCQLWNDAVVRRRARRFFNRVLATSG